MAATYLTREQCKAHLRIDYSDDDAYIDTLAELVENVVLNEIKGSIAGEGTVTTAGSTALVGDGSNFADFNVGDTITVSGETTRTIDSITDDENLTVDEAFTGSYSGLTYIMHGGFPLESGDLPLPLRQAMLLILGHFYMNRESVSVTQMTQIPYGFEFLIAPYKHYTIA